MRILEVLFTLQSGGAERFVVDLSNEMSKANEVILLTLKDDKIDEENRNFYICPKCYNDFKKYYRFKIKE